MGRGIKHGSLPLWWLSWSITSSPNAWMLYKQVPYIIFETLDIFYLNIFIYRWLSMMTSPFWLWSREMRRLQSGLSMLWRCQGVWMLSTVAILSSKQPGQVCHHWVKHNLVIFYCRGEGGLGQGHITNFRSLLKGFFWRLLLTTIICTHY